MKSNSFLNEKLKKKCLGTPMSLIRKKMTNETPSRCPEKMNGKETET